MKYLLLLLLLIPSFTLSQDENYWELYETNASSSAAKYHDILQSIEAGDLNEAKEKLLIYQGAEVLALESLQEEKQINETSKKIIKLVRKYNNEFTK